MRIQYRFSPNASKKLIFLIRFFDKIFGFFLKSKRSVTISASEITISQLAHIGDFILTLPALKKLKIETGCKINLMVSNQNYSLAKQITFIDNVIAVDAPYFARNKKISYFTFINQLRKTRSEVLFDMRGDIRNILFIKCFHKKKILVGYDVGGGGPLLDVVLPYPYDKHITTLLDPLFDFLNIPSNALSSYWDANDMPFEIVGDVDIDQKYLAVHIGTGAPARKWPVSYFIETITALARSIKIYVLGTQHDCTSGEMAAISQIPNVVNYIGRLSLLQSIYIVKHSTCFLGLESSFSHIASLLNKKTYVIFSGASNDKIWGPYSLYNEQVVLVLRKPTCSLELGCGKLVCGNNICMTDIYPKEIINLLKLSINNVVC